MASKTCPPPSKAAAKKATSGRPRGAAGVRGAAFIAGTDEQPQPRPTESSEPVKLVNGKKVVEDNPMPSPLPVREGRTPIVFHGFRVLVLEDGSSVHGCGECPESTDFTGTLAEVRAHRIQAHGMRRGGAKKGNSTSSPEIPGIVPLSLRMMPLGELLEMAAQIEQLGDLFAQLSTERDRYKERAQAAEMALRRYERTFQALGYQRQLEDND